MDVVVQLRQALQDRYEIEREIGAGGMATVYLARDLKHNRKVALKVLRPDLGAVLGAERFLSEIEVTANLQHPNLLPLFDSGEADGFLFYVMPYVEGESLRGRLEREKQLPIDDALHIATSVANALDYAHRHQVIHRDLKPENILLHEGQPLVADFGIALAVSNAGGNRITQTGLSLGTPQYMSPEQATGDRIIDGRTDIYSLAAVTYEMLTGESPHTGATSQAVIARLLTEPPRPIRVTRPTVPEHIEAAVARGLAKLPADRFNRAQEFSDALSGRTHVSVHATTAAPAPRATVTLRTLLRHPVTLALLVLALAGLGTSRSAWRLSRERAADAPIRFVLDFPDEQLASVGGSPISISPDGHLLAYVGRKSIGMPTHLYLRALDDLRSQELAGTDGATDPAFSPDGKWLAFLAGGQLKKVPIGGGTPIVLATWTTPFGISWKTMDQIVIGSSGGIAVVPSEGGPMQWVNAKEAGQEAVINKALRVGGEVDFWPLALEDGKHVMMMKWWGGSLTNGVQAVAPIGKGDTRRSNVTGTQALGMVDDYLIYASFPDALMAVPFNMRTLRTTGTAVPVVNGAAVGRAGAFKGALSQNGSLVYVAGASGVKVIIGEAHSLGRELLSEVNGYSFPRFSPDGRHLAVTMDGQSGSDVWVFDLPNGPFRKLTSGATYNIRPEWTPDSRDVVFVSNRLGRLALYKQAADGNTPPSLVLKMDGVDVYEGVISRDGKYLFFQRDSTGTSGRTYYRAQYGDTAMHVIAAANEGQQTAARVSPDGRWIAYQSDELGAKQVYVKPFPRLDARYQVSLDGGEQPVWSPDGRRIYYLAGDRLMSATLTLDPTFSVTARDTVLSDGVQGFGDYHAQFDVAPNGKDIVYTRSAGNDKVVFVHNWSRELRERMSASKRR